MYVRLLGSQILSTTNSSLFLLEFYLFFSFQHFAIVGFNPFFIIV